MQEDDKKLFIKALEVVAIMAVPDCIGLELVNDDSVKVRYTGGWRCINIAMDSKSAIVRDVFKHIN